VEHPQLTPTLSAILFVLIPESREIANPDLSKIGPSLDKRGRDTLLRHGLIESRKGARNAWYHALTDRGWAWCATELMASPPNRSLPPYRALYSVLAGIGRYLADEDLRLHELFGRPRPDESAKCSTADPSQRFVAAYHSLATHPGEFVEIAKLRTAAGIEPEAFDDAAIQLQRRAGVSLIPQEDQALLTDIDRATAVLVGTQRCHLFAIEEV